MAYTAGFSVNVGDPTKASDVTTLAANDDYLKAAVDAIMADSATPPSALKNGVTATTQSASDNSTKVATTAYADAAGVSLSGSTNNTVATVTGANALIGEANLTFDGSTLAVAGALSATGNISFDGGSFVFNEAGADKDFRIEGDSEANLFFADASTDRIGIGTNSPSTLLHLKSSGAGDPKIKIENTAADQHEGMLHFYKTGSSPADADAIGSVGFYADNSADEETLFGDMKAYTDDVTDGTEDGSIKFRTTIAGTLTDTMALVSGKVGINITDPEDYTDASGAVLVVGNTSGTPTRSGVSIITNASGIGRLAFGDGAGDPDQWRGVIQYTQSSDTMGFATAGGAVGMNFVGGNLYIGDSANGKMTKGLTINQGSGVDNEALALKSSTDVAHDCTDVAETDTYGTFTKLYGDQGGLKVSGFVDSGAQAALDLEGVTSHASPQSGKTSANNGTVNIRAYKVSSNDRAQLSANENILSIYGASATRFIFDADGDAYADSQWTTYDDHDDIAMLHDIEATMIPDLFGKCMKYDSEYLQKTGIIGEGSIRQENGKTRAMINTNRLQMLHHGAIRQVHQQLQDVKEFYEDKIAALEARLLRLEV